MHFKRILKHLVTPHWVALRAFPQSVLKKIEQAIKASETEHDGELRFAVEASLPFHFLKFSPRRRAEALFSELSVWDTEDNSGVLIYVQLLDRRIEIVADRGIAAKVEQREWDAVCRAMEGFFRKQQYLEGALEAIERITRILARHFPPRGRNPNELPDKPIVL
jgi:uncharacterized membrane protein